MIDYAGSNIVLFLIVLVISFFIVQSLGEIRINLKRLRRDEDYIMTSHLFNSVWIMTNTKREAEKLLSELKRELELTGFATLYNLHMLVNLQPDDDDRLYGWRYLEEAKITSARTGGYVLELPPPLFIPAG